MPHPFVAALERNPIILLPQANEMPVSALPPMPVIACDFYVTDSETWTPCIWGFQKDGIRNVDHHADVDRMSRMISSTNLALLYFQDEGIEWEKTVCINHTDCDSVLSSCTIRGVLGAEGRFGEAAIAADHTGRENPIADLLQSMTGLRDLAYSVENLGRLLDGKALEVEAQTRYDRRLAAREVARGQVERGIFHQVGHVMVGHFERRVEGEMYPSLLPDAELLLFFSPQREGKIGPEAKVRLGLAAPAGLTLHDLDIRGFDSNFGGRWNAGSNNRGGGTTIDLEFYAEELSRRYETALGTRSV